MKLWLLTLTVALLAHTMAIVISVSWIHEFIADSYGLVLGSEESMTSLQASVSGFIRFNVLGLAILIPLSLILVILGTHSIVGPIVAIRRQIRQLKAGEYDRPFYLRKTDELTDLVREMDELRELLNIGNNDKT